MNDIPKLRSEEEVFSCRYFPVVSQTWERPDGTTFNPIFPRRRDATMVVIVRGEGETRELFLVDQFRTTHNTIMTEFVVGISEAGETPEQTARREAEEESGFVIENPELLTVVTPTPGYNNERTHIFLARVARDGQIKPDESEVFTDRRWVSFETMKELIRTGAVTCPTTRSAFLALLLMEQ